MAIRTWFSKKIFFKNSTSIIDLLQYGLSMVWLYALVTSLFWKSVPWYFGNMPLEVCTVGSLFLFIISFASARNFWEEDITFVALIFAVYNMVGSYGVNVNQAVVNGVSNVNGYVDTMKYSATVAQVPNPTIVNPPPQNAGDANLRKWNNIGAAQDLRKVAPLTDKGLEWCNTNLNNNNQSRLHCYTKYRWTKSDWSTLNTTK